jgi:hypothetical protein
MDTINPDKPSADTEDALVEADATSSAADGTSSETSVDNGEQTATEATSAAAETTVEDGADAAADDDSDDDSDDDADDEEAERAAEAELAALRADRRPSATGVISGAVALVGLGLALASVTGTWLGTLMSEREQLIGQISASSAPAAKQLVAEFGTPWHTLAVFNGLFAVVAIIVAGVVLVNQSVTLAPLAPSWVKAVAWAALVLGVIGLVVSGVMYFDIFTDLPKVPTTAATTGAAG